MTDPEQNPSAASDNSRTPGSGLLADATKQIDEPERDPFTDLPIDPA